MDKLVSFIVALVIIYAVGGAIVNGVMDAVTGIFNPTASIFADDEFVKPPQEKVTDKVAEVFKEALRTYVNDNADRFEELDDAIVDSRGREATATILRDMTCHWIHEDGQPENERTLRCAYNDETIMDIWFMMESEDEYTTGAWIRTETVQEIMDSFIFVTE